MVRAGARVDRTRHLTLAVALDRLEERASELAAETRIEAVDLGTRRFEPAQRVGARLELRGPGRIRAGVDVHGDGSLVPHVGRLRRRRVAQLPGEPALTALRRTLGAPG